MRLEDDHEIAARAVLIATGAQYRRLPVDDLDQYEGISVFYAAGPPEAQLCGAERVAVVGGGNSAGQAAVWLARGGALVTLLHRRADLRETMSDYLMRELEHYGVAVRDSSEIAALQGTRRDSSRRSRSRLASACGSRTCSCSSARCRAPNGSVTTVERDEHGFILTGAAANAEKLSRPPCPASSRPVTFARAQPSGAPPPSVKGHGRSSSSTPTSPQGDGDGLDESELPGVNLRAGPRASA